MRAGCLGGHAKRRAFGLFGVGSFHEAGLRHAVDYPIAPFERTLTLAEWMIVTGRFRQRCKVGRFGDCELVHCLVEIDKRGRGDAIGTKA